MHLRIPDNESLEGLITTEVYTAISNSTNGVINIDKELLAFDGDIAKIEHCDNKALTLINNLEINNDDIDDSEKRQATNFLRKVEVGGIVDIQYFIDLQCKYFVRDEIGDSFYNKTAINDEESLKRNYNLQSAIIIEKIIKVNNLTQGKNSLYLEKIENFKKYMVIAIESHYYKVIASSIRSGKYTKRSPTVLSVREERIKKENLKLNDIIKNGLNLKDHSFDINHEIKDLWSQTYLTDLKNSLERKGFIQKTSASDFKKIFNGKEVIKKIIWLTYLTDLAYFIQNLIKVRVMVKIKKNNKVSEESFILIEDTKLKHWEITTRCFVKEDGTPYSQSEFLSLKKPAKSNIIDKCLTTLN